MWISAVLLLPAMALLFIKRKRIYSGFYILSKTARRDIRACRGYIKLNIKLRWIRFKNYTVASIFSSLVRKHPRKEAFLFEDEVWTFSEVEEYSNKTAKYFEEQGLQKGDCVALMLENRPEYPCIWLGLSKIGVVTALINTNLVKDSLVHCIKIANSKAIIFGSNHTQAIREIQDDFKSTKFYQFHETPKEVMETSFPNCADLRYQLMGISGSALQKTVQINVTDPLMYIYTSGTTGLPKAAVVSNIRYMLPAWALTIMVNLKPNDIMYTALPLYHTAGGTLGVGQALLSGFTVVIRKKFSATNYWKDCAKYNCTVAQYVGEICRYILATEYKEPVKHSVRAICGNGLKPHIWKKFVNKFNIKEVYEFYAATEGIANMVNLDNTVGAVGFVPTYARGFYPVTLIKCNENTGEPIRNEDGHCTECKPNEIGLLVGKIKEKGSIFAFHGYIDKKATQDKILRNVFRQGDSYFNSGDTLLSDELGNFFFKDRTGDTFRWKGENVSTSEVEAIISSIIQLNDAVVFGVQIPETEGRAGMAAIEGTSKTLDLDIISRGVQTHLPSYAIPLFVRIMESVPLTGTYKLKKFELQAEGYDVDKVKDTIYFYNSSLKKYVHLTKDLYKEIVTGKLKY